MTLAISPTAVVSFLVWKEPGQWHPMPTLEGLTQDSLTVSFLLRLPVGITAGFSNIGSQRGLTNPERQGIRTAFPTA